MISLLRYISARRSLKEINKTIEVMGGDDAPPTLLAQYDMTELEVAYHYYEFWKEVIYTLLVIIILYTVYDNFGGNYAKDYLREVWERISSWNVQALAWRKL